MSDTIAPCPEHEHFATQVEFSSNQHQEGSPETEFQQELGEPPLRQFFNERFRFSDGLEIELWTFHDGTGKRFPAPLVRTTEGTVFQAYLKPGKGPHTIHWHGIEPDPRNDGVGHTSFEVTGGYLFQWKTERGVPGNPNKGTGGTYFYHCHVNTVLHVQMGMFGPLIVDPIVHPDFPVPDPKTARRSFVDGPLYDVATEVLLVPYSIDPRWHSFNHAAGLSGEDVGLNRFEPTNFYLLGGQLNVPSTGEGVQELDQIRLRDAQRDGDVAPTLLRVLNANYFPTVLSFTESDGSTPVKLGEVIAHDGRPFRDTSSLFEGESRPARVTGQPIDVHKLGFGAAERYDLLLWPPLGKRQFMAHVEWLHWVRRNKNGSPVVVGKRTIPIVVE